MSTKFKFILSAGAINLMQVGGMVLAPLLFVFLGYWKKVSDVVVYGAIFLVSMMVCSLCSSNVVSWQRIIYRGLFIMMFICVHYSINEGRVNLMDIKGLLKGLIIAYGVILILQNLAFAVGIKQLAIINLDASVTMAGIYKPNGLSGEPSHSARILTVLYWGYLKLLEIQNNNPVTFKDTWQKYKLETGLFWFSMISMGSATAIIGCLLILLYFFKKNASLLLIGCLVFIMLMNVDIDNVQIKRIQIVFNSLFSDDVAGSLKLHEGSGAVRIMPIINTLTNLDLFSLNSWIGQGSIQNLNTSFVERMFSETRYIGDVSDFGLFTYLASLLFVYKCCIRHFFSMESLLFLCLATFSVGSIYYTWLMLIVFSIVKYYTEFYNNLENVSSITIEE